MSEPAKQKNPLGPTGVTAAARVRELREAHRWGYKELSDRLAEAGRPIPPLGIRRIEALDRRIDADDLVALAVVLGVNPSSLLLPLHTHGRIEVTGIAGTVRARDAWRWVDGKHTLPPDPEGERAVWLQEHGRPPSRQTFRWRTRPEREALARIYEKVPGAAVVRDTDGDPNRIELDGKIIAPPPDLDLRPDLDDLELDEGDDNGR